MRKSILVSTKAKASSLVTGSKASSMVNVSKASSIVNGSKALAKEKNEVVFAGSAIVSESSPLVMKVSHGGDTMDSANVLVQDVDDDGGDFGYDSSSSPGGVNSLGETDNSDYGEEDDDNLNNHQNDKKIPFENMIYIGDGLTDVPCMKLLKDKGGRSIALYPSTNQKKQALKLVEDERINYVCVADYRENSTLEKIVKLMMNNVSIISELKDKEQKQIQAFKKASEA